MNSPVDHAIESLLASHDSFAMRDLQEATGLSRQALQRHVARWVVAGALQRFGGGRSVRYRRSRGPEIRFEYPTPGLSEYDVWRELESELRQRLPQLTEQAAGILHHATTELVNNAIDHSGADRLVVRASARIDRIEIAVDDEGLGAFETVRSRIGLEDTIHALQELSKGKVTTQPERHSGEGLFFTSKAVDRFQLHANGLVWLVDNVQHDVAIAEEPDEPGTRVHVQVDPRTQRTMEEVFAGYTTDPDELAFDRTRGFVRLFKYGTRFVSRSEAKRLATGLDRFREVLVDFAGVDGVGQGFVDELFRVWARAHPGTKLIPVNMNRAVDFMVRRGLPRG